MPTPHPQYLHPFKKLWANTFSSNFLHSATFLASLDSWRERFWWQNYVYLSLAQRRQGTSPQLPTGAAKEQPEPWKQL